MNLNTKKSGIRPFAHGLLLSLVFPGISLADGVSQHAFSSNVLNTTGDLELSEHTPKILKAAPTTLGAQALFGEWSDVVSWPLVAVHANLLPNGKVLAWDATPDDSDDDPHTTSSYTTRVSLWDPQSGIHIATNNDTNSDLFCAGSAHLWDGRILFAGGDSGTNGANGPLENTSVYDPETNTWRRVSNMATPRWYSSVAALSNGEMLTFAGTYNPQPIAEVYQFNETWRPLSLQMPYEFPGDYQWLQATPEGNVISFGPQNTIGTIDTQGTGLWTTGPQRDEIEHRTYGSYAMYDVGKIIVSGGSDQSTDSAVIIDTLTQQTSSTGSMNFGRTQHNLTILADGSVLATGGNYDGTYLINPDTGVYTPEIWSPSTGEWKVMNDMQVNRQYHSTALLLPDGRVLSAGGGICGDCYAVGYLEQNAEIFSPPYLFSSGNRLAVRPRITSGPVAINYASEFSITTDQSGSIAKAHLIKLGAVTHSQNQDQRLVPLDFSRSGTTLAIDAPSNRDIAPPGHYMLFIVDEAGVPSVGEIIKVGQPLLSSGQSVSNSIRGGKTETYVIESSTQDTSVIARLDGLTSNTRLTLSNAADTSQATQVCSIISESRNSIQCNLPNRSSGQWYVEVTALNGETPYTLVTTLNSNTASGFNNPLATNATLLDRVGLKDWSYYSISVPAGQNRLSISLNGLTADADLYVRQGERPTGNSDEGGIYDCASYRFGRSQEQCVIENAAGKTWIIGVYGFLAAGYSLETSTSVVAPSITDITLGTLRLNLEANNWKYLKVSRDLISGNLSVQLSGMNEDADLYLKVDIPPGRSVEQWGDNDCASFAGGADNEFCQIPNAQRDVYIAIYAHKSTTVTATVSTGTNPVDNQNTETKIGKSELISIKNAGAEGGAPVNVDFYSGEGETIDTSGNAGTGSVQTGGGGACGPTFLLFLIFGFFRQIIREKQTNQRCS